MKYRSIAAENPAKTDVLGDELEALAPPSDVLFSLQGMTCVLDSKMVPDAAECEESSSNLNSQVTMMQMPSEIRGGNRSALPSDP